MGDCGFDAETILVIKSRGSGCVIRRSGFAFGIKGGVVILDTRTLEGEGTLLVPVVVLPS